MATTIKFRIDGREIEAGRGQTILEAAEAAGVDIPRLCWSEGLEPAAECRVCTVKVNGRPVSACTQPVMPGAIVENDTAELRSMRADLVDMMFVEGNHVCASCEISGDCELQVLAERFGITEPKYPFVFPRREIDDSHPEVVLDHNRCILCGRCVVASREIDGKSVFGFVGRGPDKRLAVNAAAGLGGTDVATTDAAVSCCPTRALLARRNGDPGEPPAE